MNLFALCGSVAFVAFFAHDVSLAMPKAKAAVVAGVIGFRCSSCVEARRPTQLKHRISLLRQLRLHQFVPENFKDVLMRRLIPISHMAV